MRGVAVVKKRSAWQIQKAVLLALFIRELKTRFGAHRFGYIWVLLEPTLHMLVIVFIMSFLRGRGPRMGIDFPIFLFVGLIPFLLFKNIALRTMSGVEGNKGLFSYRQVKPMDAFVSRATLEVVLYSAVYLIMLIFLGWLGFPVVPAAPLQLILLHLLVVVFGLGFGLMLSVLRDVVPEAQIMVRVFFMPLYFLSGVLFPLYLVPREWVSFLLWNPLLHFVELARSCFFADYPLFSQISLQYVLVVTVVAVFFGLALYRVRRFQMVAS